MIDYIYENESFVTFYICDLAYKFIKTHKLTGEN
jgi:hypothetical protein